MTVLKHENHDAVLQGDGASESEERRKEATAARRPAWAAQRPVLAASNFSCAGEEASEATPLAPAKRVACDLRQTACQDAKIGAGAPSLGRRCG
jgi:hypothetical protein